MDIANVSFAAVNKDLASKLSKLRSAIKTKKELIGDILQDEDISRGEFQKIISNGFALGLPPRIKQSAATKLVKLNTAINANNGTIALLNAERKALTDCQKKRTNFTVDIPAQGGALLATSFNGTAAIGVLVILDDPSRNSPLDSRFAYCAKGLTKSTSTDGRFVVRFARKNPCASLGFGVDSCPMPVGQLGVLMAVTILPPNFVSDPIRLASEIAALNEGYQDTYSFKPVGDSETSPCGYLN